MGPGNGIGALLNDVRNRHGDLMRLVENAGDQISVARIQRSAGQYAGAVSRYRTALLELVTSDLQGKKRASQVKNRRKPCVDLRWRVNQKSVSVKGKKTPR